MIRSILPLLLCGILLESCASDFTSQESRENTWFYLHDSMQFRAELIGVVRDSIVVIPWDTALIVRTIAANDVEVVVLSNAASELINVVGGVVGGAIAGGLVGTGLGKLSDRSINYNSDYPQIIFAEHSGWGALTGLLLGAPAGAIAGLFVAIVQSSDTDIWMDDDNALERLRGFARFGSEMEARRFRGY